MSSVALREEEFGKALRSMAANIRLQNRILERVEGRSVAEIDKGRELRRRLRRRRKRMRMTRRRTMCADHRVVVGGGFRWGSGGIG